MGLVEVAAAHRKPRPRRRRAARYLATSMADLDAMLAAVTRERAELLTTAGGDRRRPSRTHKHLLVVVDDPQASTAAVRRPAARDGVTVIVHRGRGTRPGLHPASAGS